MEEEKQFDALLERMERRRQLQQEPKWKRIAHRYWPAIRMTLVCLAVVLVVFGVAKLSSASVDATLSTEPTATEPPTTEPPVTEPPKDISPVPGVGGVIYLTFDDGPGAETPRLLEILSKYNAKVTFFVVNTPFVSTVAQIAAEGHALAMHTATHDFQKIYSSQEAYFADLEKIESIIEEYAGFRPVLLRFPGGSSNGVSRKYCDGIMTALTRRVEEKGYIYHDWNVDSCDAGGASTAAEVAENVIQGCSTRTSSVVLMHDIRSYTIDAIEDILLWGQANGYTFESLTTDTPAVHHKVKN